MHMHLKARFGVHFSRAPRQESLHFISCAVYFRLSLGVYIYMHFEGVLHTIVFDDIRPENESIDLCWGIFVFLFLRETTTLEPSKTPVNKSMVILIDTLAIKSRNMELGS